jgi:hypothetical protein
MILTPVCYGPPDVGVETNSNSPTNIIVAITLFFENLFSIVVEIVTKWYIRIVDNLVHCDKILIFVIDFFLFLFI